MSRGDGGSSPRWKRLTTRRGTRPAPVSYLGQYLPIDASYRTALDALRFGAALGNHGELDHELEPEPGTAPTRMTGG